MLLVAWQPGADASDDLALGAALLVDRVYCRIPQVLAALSGTKLVLDASVLVVQIPDVLVAPCIHSRLALRPAMPHHVSGNVTGCGMPFNTRERYTSSA